MDFRKRNEPNHCLHNFLFNFNFKCGYDIIFCLEFILMRGSTKWLWQRISAVALVPLSYWFVITFLNLLHASQNQKIDLFSSPLSKFLMVIFFLIAIFHARLGLKTIYEDYFTISQVKIFSLITDIVLFLTLIAVIPVLFI